ncbi:uracil-DNA glycosylase family protein [Exiguobacterium sp. ERU656]|uniref:uracil-DNA glycosylase family protein n=1 Tax=Exiguobacterium sp. ERU656 TaxID=2751217 RepID=UPI001BE842A0|nr:uracil-DNA glycosylase family protein [Exiguobacterium sp. ERU656]
MIDSLTIFEQVIRDLPVDRSLTREDICTEDFLLQTEHKLSVYYSPIGDYINPFAKVIIVGITPGLEQMRIAFEEMADALHHGVSLEEAAKIANYSASFSGVMRRNLVTMLDELDFATMLSIPTTATLFNEHQELLHATSILKHPVFYRGKNYSGHQPKIDRIPLLRHYAYEHFAAELNQLNEPALIIPLGRIVEATVRTLLHQGRIRKHFLLSGFPHPSGANGHRKRQFEDNRSYLNQQLIHYFTRSD